MAYSTLYNGINVNARPYSADYMGFSGPEYLGGGFSGGRRGGVTLPTQAHARLAALALYNEKRGKSDKKYTRTFLNAVQPTSANQACYNLLLNLSTGTDSLNEFTGSYVSPLYFDILITLVSAISPAATVVIRIFQYDSTEAPPAQNLLLYANALTTVMPTDPAKLSIIKYHRAYSISLPRYGTTTNAIKLIRDKISGRRLAPMRANSTSGAPLGMMNLWMAVYANVTASGNLQMSATFELGFLDSIMLPTIDYQSY